VHPREVDEYFSHGSITNYWGGRSNATTHLLDAMHYRGLLRVVRREAGIRIYAVHEHAAAELDVEACRQRMDALADAAIAIYAPLPLFSLRFLLRRLRYAAPQWEHLIKGATDRAKQRLAHAKLDGVDWYWPAEWKRRRSEPEEKVRLLTPFDPVVWDRWRFEMLWGWTYRFEAYTPVTKRVRGYYTMPMLWRDRVIGWGNLSVSDGSLHPEFGYLGPPPRDVLFKRELEAELERMQEFLRLDASKNASRSSTQNDAVSKD
jgi:hypothetical protein